MCYSQECGNIEPTTTHFHYSCPAPHILCIQFSFNLQDIHYIYQAMFYMNGCFHTTAYSYRMCIWTTLVPYYEGSMIECVEFYFNNIGQMG